MTKTNYFKGLCLVTAMLCAAFGAHAQRFETSVYFNGLLPVREFNDKVVLDPLGTFAPMEITDVAKAASAGLGATGRFGVWFDVGVGQVLPFVEASFYWNASKSSIRDLYDENATSAEIPVAPNYFNIPMQFGIKYRYDITPVVKPFFEMAIGYDALFISTNGYKKTADKRFAYIPDGTLCWSLGAGTYLGENVSLGFYYLGLGNHRIKYTSRTQSNLGSDSVLEKRKLGEIGLRVGFHFGARR